jgi:hypothetical protein
VEWNDSCEQDNEQVEPFKLKAVTVIVIHDWEMNKDGEIAKFPIDEELTTTV